MRIVRTAVVAVILFNLALLAVYGPFRCTRLRYDVARKQRELRAAHLERQALFHDVARARRPDQVVARAVALGVDVHAIEQEALAASAGPSPEVSRPAVVPRR